MLETTCQADAGRVDLVLMDVMMPEMDGLTATGEIRNRAWGKDLPIIALTAKAAENDHEQCIAAGANDYLAKPPDNDKLCRTEGRRAGKEGVSKCRSWWSQKHK